MAFPAKSAALPVAALFAAACFPLAAFAQAQPAQRQPVLVELFTSEGCSDCPPADELLGELDAHQPIPGAEAIVLSEHVTYWNHDGWRDPFSLDEMTDRQQDYARQFGLSDVYTPQMVVDGAEQLVGNDAGKLAAAVARAAASPKVSVDIAAHPLPDGSIAFSAHAAGNQLSLSKPSLYAAIAENATVSEVLRGENQGRTLHHVAVVRVLREFGAGKADGRTLELSGAGLRNAEIDAKKNGTSLRLVVFLVSSRDNHVVGAAEQRLGAAPSGTIEQSRKAAQSPAIAVEASARLLP